MPNLGCLIMTAIFSAHYIVAKSIIDKGISPYSLSSWRGIIGGAIILSFFRKQIKIELLKKNKAPLIIISLFGFCLNQILFMQGLKLTSPVNAALISNTIPVVSLVFAAFAKLEILNVRKVAGVTLSFLMVSALIFESSKGVIEIMGLGNLFIFLNVVCFCASLILGKILLTSGFPFQVLTGIMLFTGGLCTSIVAGPELMDLWTSSSEVPQFFMKVIFEILISTAVAYLMNLWVLSKLPISNVTFFIYLQPLITGMIYYFTGQAIPSIIQTVAFCGILTGAILIKDP